MYQLIYTSAPRLLEAGKTGFGTVARSKELPRPLVSYLERLSVFDRSAGIPALQFYSTFRMGALRYRVFSQVMDCGVDYTRRTNHTAHHFVIPIGSEEESALQGSTPAGVMLALQSLFRRSWTEAPAWLSELPLPGSLCPETGGMWQRLTGDAANADWLAASRFSNSCCLCVDAPMEMTQLLALLHEGQMMQMNHGWERAFSTAIVDNLSNSAFPLVCLEGRQQRAGVRPRASVTCLNVRPGLVAPTEADFPRVTVPAADVEEIVAAPGSDPYISDPYPSSQSWQVPQEEQSPPLRYFEPAPAVPQRPAVDTSAEEGRNTYSYYIAGGIVAILALLLYMQRDSHPASEKPSTPMPVAKPQPGKDGKPGTGEEDKGGRGNKPGQEAEKTPTGASSQPKEAQKPAPAFPAPSSSQTSPDSGSQPGKDGNPGTGEADRDGRGNKPGQEEEKTPMDTPSQPKESPNPAPTSSAPPSSQPSPDFRPQQGKDEKPTSEDQEQSPNHYEKCPDEVIFISEGEGVFIFELRWRIDVSDIREQMRLRKDAIFYRKVGDKREIEEPFSKKHVHKQPWSGELKQKESQARKLQKEHEKQLKEKKVNQQVMSELKKAEDDFRHHRDTEREALEERLHQTPLRVTPMELNGGVYQLHIEPIIVK